MPFVTLGGQPVTVRDAIVIRAVGALAAVRLPATPSQAARDERIRLSLDGAWRFAIDPSRDGERAIETTIAATLFESASDVTHVGPSGEVR